MWWNPMTWLRQKTTPKPFPRLGVRGYAGASTGRLLNDFASPASSADKEIRPALKTLRNRCREMCRNEPIATRALQVFRTQVVGDKGLHLQVRARNLPQPGETKGTLDIAGNDMVERAWKRWTRRGVCEVSGRHSWIDCQQLVQESLVRDGEVLVKYVREMPSKANPFGFALQFLEPDHLDEQLNSQSGDVRIVMGVELDSANRPVGYHLFDGPGHPGDDLNYGGPNGKRVRRPASEILHIYRPDRVQQTRGVPLFASVMDKLHQQNAHLEAELVASRLAASKSLWLESEDGQGYAGDDFDGFAPILDAGEPGSITQLPPGVKVTAPPMDHPSTAFSDFQKSVLRQIAGGLGLDYVTLSNNLESVSYSSIRAGTIESRDNYRVHQTFLAEHFAQPVFREWLQMGITSGALPFPSDRFDKFADSAVFRGRGYQWVDPLKEVRAAAEGLESGFLTFSDVAQQVGGRDVEETFSTLQSDIEMAERFNLTMNVLPLGKKKAATPEIETDDGN